MKKSGHTPELRILQGRDTTSNAAAELKHGSNGTSAKNMLMESMLSERNLLKRYPHMIQGSLSYDKEVMRQTAQIQCEDCGIPRRIFTSDLFQVKQCGDCVAEARQARRRETRKDRRAMDRN